jgi:hypothetical protein
VEASSGLDSGGTVVAENLVHLVGAELVVAGGNGSMGGKDALLGHSVTVGVGGFAERAAGEALFKKSDGEQRGVALVHVVDLGFAAESVEKRYAAESEDSFLAEAVVGVATVKVVGELAIPRVIALDIGVQKVYRDDVARDAFDVEAPGANEELAALEGKGDDLVRTW